MTLLELAPLSQSYDLFIYLLIMLTPVVWIPKAIKASKSGTKMFDHMQNKWIYSNERIPVYKTGQFLFACLHFVLVQVFFWAMLWPSYQDVWFIK